MLVFNKKSDCPVDGSIAPGRRSIFVNGKEVDTSPRRLAPWTGQKGGISANLRGRRVDAAA